MKSSFPTPVFPQEVSSNDSPAPFSNPPMIRDSFHSIRPNPPRSPRPIYPAFLVLVNHVPFDGEFSFDQQRPRFKTAHNPSYFFFPILLDKFDFDQIQHEFASNPLIRYIICVNCGKPFNRDLDHSLLLQHFDAEYHRAAIDVEHRKVILIKKMLPLPLPIQPSLESFYLSLLPDLLSSWITDRFFKPFNVMT
jgi:hypothetical protein